MISFPVGRLINRPAGSQEEFDITDSMEFGHADELKIQKPIQAHVKFLKLPQEINVQLTNLTTVVELSCNRCTKLFSQGLEIPFVEREFILDLPERDLEAGEVVGYVNQATNEIELDDMIREELLLHFPGVPLCFEGCKGLCDKCGTDLNEKTCSCPHDTYLGVKLKM